MTTALRVALCYVVGSPIRHSRSPFIHRLFAEQFGLALRYERCELAPGALAGAVARFIADGARGINVTLPLKEEAITLAHACSARATAAGAANVLSFGSDGRIEADNTDGVGMVRDLMTHGVALTGRRVLLLGAGGAARGVVPALFDAGVAEVAIVNRTHDKALALVRHFATLGAIRALAADDRCAAPADLIINATSAGLTSPTPPPVPAGALGAATACYDLVYGSAETVFLGWARAQGAGTRIDGLGMLVEQAAVAFAAWHGHVPSTAPVIDALRKRL